MIQEINQKNLKFLVAILLSVLWAGYVFSHGWVTDDIYVMFHVIDNVLQGFGLRLNGEDQGQITNGPLWLFINIPLYLVWPNPAQVSIAMGVFASTLAVFLLLRLCPNIFIQLVVFVLLAGSHSLTDFATSGLENSLSYLLLAWMATMFCRTPPRRYDAFWLMLAASGAMLNRFDMVVMCVPIVLLAFASCCVRLRFSQTMLGLLPLAAWLVFATFYYGSPLPSDYWVKLNDVLMRNNLQQGMYYLKAHFYHDPVGSLILAAGVLVWLQELVCLVWNRQLQSGVFAFSSAMLLQVIYVIHIGGDTLSGRYLANAEIAALAALALYARKLAELGSARRFYLLIAIAASAMYGGANEEILACWKERNLCPVEINGVEDKRRIITGEPEIAALTEN